MEPHRFLYGPLADDPDEDNLEALMVAFSEHAAQLESMTGDMISAFAEGLA